MEWRFFPEPIHVKITFYLLHSKFRVFTRTRPHAPFQPNIIFILAQVLHQHYLQQNLSMDSSEFKPAACNTFEQIAHRHDMLGRVTMLHDST